MTTLSDWDDITPFDGSLLHWQVPIRQAPREASLSTSLCQTKRQDANFWRTRQAQSGQSKGSGKNLAIKTTSPETASWFIYSYLSQTSPERLVRTISCIDMRVLSFSFYCRTVIITYFPFLFCFSFPFMLSSTPTFHGHAQSRRSSCFKLASTRG